MKKLLLLIAFITGVSAFAQVQPTVHNSNFDKIAKSSGSDASSAGWIQKDLGDQAETSTLDNGFAVKFDDLESDAIYQEVAVEANSTYKFTYEYSFEDKGTDDTLSKLEIRILAGSAYAPGYTPVYADPATAEQDDLGYKDIADVIDPANNLDSVIVEYPGDEDYRTGVIYFETGDETSIAIFARGIGRNSLSTDDKGQAYPWSNGNCEVRLDSVTLTNLTIPVIHNSNFDKIAKSSGSDASSAGWIQKDLGDQAETSTLDNGFAVKFDDLESDAIYQEIAVDPNVDYKFTFEYSFENKGTDDTLSKLEIRILAGSAYALGYTPVYADPATAEQDDLGYKDIADVIDAANNLDSVIIEYPGDEDYRTGVIYFNSGDESSIALFARGIGRNSLSTDDKGQAYPWSNGNCEVRIDSVTLTFGIAPDDIPSISNDTTLSDLQVDGATVTGFASDIFSYDIELAAGTTTVPTVTATATSETAEDPVVTPAASLPGTTTVLVTAEDGSTATYSVIFTVAVVLDSDSTLSDLRVDDVTVTGFASDIFSYDVELDAGTTIVPTVTATATSASAETPVVTPAASLPGTTTVLVTAEDGSEATYSVVFTVASTSTLSELINLDFSIYAYNDILHVKSAEELFKGRVDVYNISGMMVASHSIDSNSEEFALNSKGLFIVTVTNSMNEIVNTQKIVNK